LTTYGYLFSFSVDDGGVQVHRLQVPAPVPVWNCRIQTAHLRTQGIKARPSSHNAGPQLLPVLRHEKGLVGKASDDAVWAIDDQASTGVFEMFQEISVWMVLDIFVFKRCDDMFVRLDAHAQLIEHEMEDMGEDL
jgi:hypothetical protein